MKLKQENMKLKNNESKKSDINQSCTAEILFIYLSVVENKVTLPCSHFFCKVCIDSWSERTRSCPQCRTNF